MKLLAISDIHERVGKVSALYAKLREEAFKPDLIVVAGDITYFKDMGTARQILTKIYELFGVKVLFVPGNCDPPGLLKVKEFGTNVINLHLRIVNMEEYTFYGVGGGGISPFNTLIEFTEEQFKEFMSKLDNLSSKSRLILVTHQPVYGFFDDVNGDKIGSKTFAEYLYKVKPLLWITGHVHENSGWTVVEKTAIVHPGPLMRGRYAIIELEGDVAKSVNIGKLKDPI